MMPSNTTASISPTTNQLNNNDNSNPQQGTGVQTAQTIVQQAPVKAPMKNGNDSFGGRANTMRSPPNKKDSRKLFVGGLPADITEDEFRTFFGQFGEIVDSVVMFDRETHRSRGFGFVTFLSPEVADTLLKMGQDEGKKEDGASAVVGNTPRVGRLVMRGKTCEVKAAEPKESSRPNRRNFQNIGSGGATNRGFVDKAYPPGAQQPSIPHAGAYHDPHYMAGHHYPMVSPPYYPAYHPGMGMYHGGGPYHPGPMYTPVADPVPMHGNDVLHVHQPYVTPGVDGAHVAPYVEGETGHGHSYAPYGHAYVPYGHPPQIQAAYPPHPGVQGPPSKAGPGAFAAHGAPSSVMHPAAPGLPTKDE